MRRGNVFLVFVAGFALIGLSYWGNHQPKTVAAPQETQSPAVSAMAPQTTTEVDASSSSNATSGANAQGANVQIVSLKGQVASNGYQTVVAKVPPHSKAHLEVDVDGSPFQNSLLVDKTADANGQVSWTWKVVGDVDDPVAITVSDAGAEADSMFQIVQ